MLELKNITVTIKIIDRPLIKNLSITLNEGDKAAIIGEEGNGKSTLIKLIYDQSLVSDFCNIEGQIIKKGSKVGYLEQFLNPKWDNKTISDYFLKDNTDDEVDYDKYNSFSLLPPILSKMGLDSEIIYSDQKINTLSGGEKVKIQLAKILYQNPDILLLDEPTNDLDMETLIWLEKFINSTNIPIIYVSHDETLLENTANTIIHLEQIKRKSEAKSTVEKIGYREYVEKRLGMIQKQEQVARKQRAEHQAQIAQWRQVFNKVEYQQDTISRSDPSGGRLLKKKMKTLKAQERRFKQNEENFLDIPDVEEAINFGFSDNINIPNNKNILNIDINELYINDKKLSSNIKLNVIGPEHIVIVGKNGVGKTTLFNHIYHSMQNRNDIKVGYMPQNYENLIDAQKTGVDFLITEGTAEDITKVRTFMGCMKFTSEEMTTKIKNLSGGQRAKLLLLKLIVEDCNVLLLDEPTRNLSPLSNPVIRNVLSLYNGAIISISHDRKYIEEVCDTVYELTNTGLWPKNNYLEELKKDININDLKGKVNSTNKD